ncbi:glycoside hydrolase family 16 protein [Burkholderia sp. WAC0059]|uniref:glycoside hydrolase family 16 protein n=1 Tax=Burkholderia sp. WAC0059 TaxID=2066022 RepID=UPI0015E128B5|nr:glycoside hydrolase family 16 protein [Burkholderia sp. WAC0059]
MLIAAAKPASTAVSVSAPAPAPSHAPHAGDIDLTGYTLTFEDNFDRLSVATRSPKGSATWLHIPPYGPASNYSASRWDSRALSVSGGVLSIKAYVDPAGTWRSGNLSSMDETGQGFAQRYGYFEVRARMPASGTGSWPAFWLLSSTSINNTSGKKFSEIDIFEWYGNTYTDNRAVIQEATHNWASGGTRSEGAQFYSPATPMPDGAKPWRRYHIYGCQIDPVHITWYIDGIQTNQIPTSDAADYMTGPYYMMLDYALGGGWPVDKVVDGSTFDINWVRVYALPASVGRSG